MLPVVLLWDSKIRAVENPLLLLPVHVAARGCFTFTSRRLIWGRRKCKIGWAVGCSRAGNFLIVIFFSLALGSVCLRTVWLQDSLSFSWHVHCAPIEHMRPMLGLQYNINPKQVKVDHEVCQARISDHLGVRNSSTASDYVSQAEHSAQTANQAVRHRLQCWVPVSWHRECKL